jgi:hypothetical protein
VNHPVVGRKRLASRRSSERSLVPGYLDAVRAVHFPIASSGPERTGATDDVLGPLVKHRRRGRVEFHDSALGIAHHHRVGHLLDDGGLLASLAARRVTGGGSRQGHRHLTGHRDEHRFVVLRKRGWRGARGGDDAQRALLRDQRGDHQRSRIDLSFDVTQGGGIRAHIVDADQAALTERAARETITRLERKRLNRAVGFGAGHELQHAVGIGQGDGAAHLVVGRVAEQAGHRGHRRRERFMDALASRDGLGQVRQRLGLVAGRAFATH